MGILAGDCSANLRMAAGRTRRDEGHAVSPEKKEYDREHSVEITFEMEFFREEHDAFLFLGAKMRFIEEHDDGRAGQQTQQGGAAMVAKAFVADEVGISCDNDLALSPLAANQNRIGFGVVERLPFRFHADKINCRFPGDIGFDFDSIQRHGKYLGFIIGLLEVQLGGSGSRSLFFAGNAGDLPTETPQRGKRGLISLFRYFTRVIGINLRLSFFFFAKFITLVFLLRCLHLFGVVIRRGCGGRGRSRCR